MQFHLYRCSYQKLKNHLVISPHPNHYVQSIVPPTCVSNISTFLPSPQPLTMSHQNHPNNLLVSDSVLAPLSPLSKNSQGGLILCLSQLRTLQGFSYVAGKPLSAAAASSQVSSQPFNYLASFQFLRKKKTKKLSPFLSQSLCTYSFCCLESSSFITHLIDSFSPFKWSVQMVTSSESTFL